MTVTWACAAGAAADAATPNAIIRAAAEILTGSRMGAPSG
jgi:hypothetical protein